MDSDKYLIVLRLFQEPEEILFPTNTPRIPSGTVPGSWEMHGFPHFPAGLGRGWMRIIRNDFREV